jgi:hypothetical protein
VKASNNLKEVDNMKSNTLENLEKKMYQSYFQDGLWDIFLGLLFLFMGVRSLSGNVWYTLLALSGIPVFILGKRFITIPRMGYVKFGETRKKKRRNLIVIILVAIIVTYSILFISLTGSSLNTLFTGVFLGLMISTIFMVMAYFLDFTRLYFYALLFGIAISINELFWGHPMAPLALSLSGGFVLSLGCILLIRFMKTYTPHQDVTEVNP